MSRQFIVGGCRNWPLQGVVGGIVGERVFAAADELGEGSRHPPSARRVSSLPLPILKTIKSRRTVEGLINAV